MKLPFPKLYLVSLLALSTSAVTLAEDSRYIIQVDNTKKGVVKALAKKMGGELNLDADGFIAATFEGKSLSEVKGLLNNPHIKVIEEDLRRYPTALYNDDLGDPNATQVTPYAIYQSQADQLTLQAGQKVCVIDSGIAQNQGETGGHNPDFNWSVITGDNDSGTGNWNEDGGPHGTHVAGTVAAADNGIGVVGMAPGVPMHIIKVFNASGWGYSSDLAHAADLCTQAGSNIITMSLGGGGSNSTEENAFNTFTDNGGLVLAAAGNDGNNVRSYPAGYKSVMMIGANDSDNNIASFSQYPSNTKTTGRGRNQTTETDDGYGVEVTAGGVGTLSTYPSGSAVLSILSMDSNGIASSAMENNGGATGDTYYMGLGDAVDSGAAGNICVIDRGEISFHDKTKNCEDSGGLGAVIINNESGMLYGTLGDTNTTSIPVVGTALEDRTAIMAATTADINVTISDYGHMSGTSMATPAAAGAAALIWSNHPGCTGTEIREAMKATAEDQGDIGRDDYFGYGIVKAKAAVDYLAGQPCGGGSVDNPPSASFSSSCNELSCNFTDTSSDDNSISSYNWNFGDGITSTSQNPSHTYSADGTYTVTLTVTDTVGQTDSSSQSVTVTSGTPVDNAPTASFSDNCSDLDCSFDASGSNDDNGISSYSWDFGDGNTGSGVNANHSYSSAGTYTVTLTVTDTIGQTDTSSRSVTVSEPPSGGDIQLSANGYKTKGRQNVDLSWSGANGGSVDIYRDGTVIATTANDGAYTDAIGRRGGGSYTYQVCEAGTSTCSATVNVVF